MENFRDFNFPTEPSTRCVESCKNCSAPSTNCTECYFGYDLVQNNDRENESRCEANGEIENLSHFNFPTEPVTRCIESCKNCSVPASNCTECYFGYDLVQNNDRENESRCEANGEIENLKDFNFPTEPILFCDKSCKTCFVVKTNCTECYFGYDKVWNNDSSESRCELNGKIGYSAVAVTGVLVGLLGGLYYFGKKKEEQKSRRKQALSEPDNEVTLLTCH